MGRLLDRAVGPSDLASTEHKRAEARPLEPVGRLELHEPLRSRKRAVLIVGHATITPVGIPDERILDRKRIAGMGQNLSIRFLERTRRACGRGHR